MPQQIEMPYPFGTGLSTLYALVRERSTGKVWSTVAVGFVTEVVASRANYAIALAENVAGSYFYVADFPAAAAGVYDYYVYLRSGGSPAASDTLVGVETNFEWSGTAPLPLSTIQSQNVKTLAAVYDSAAVSGDVITLSNGATQTIDSSGRTTAP